MIAHPIHRTSILLNLLTVLVLASGGATAAQPTTGSEVTGAGTPPADAVFRASPVMFIENAGQWPDAARFQVWGAPAGTLWLAEDAIWLTVVAPGDWGPGTGDRERGGSPSQFSDVGASSTEQPGRGVNVRLSFAGANQHPRIEPFDPLDTVVSYFIGSERDLWRPAVPVWGGVRYVDLYPGVDLEITSEAGRMVQRLAARPGADLSAVRLRVEGADDVAMEGDALRLSTAASDVAWPMARTDGLKVEGLQVEGSGVENLQRVGVPAFEVAVPFAPLNAEVQLQSAVPQSAADNPADLRFGTFIGGSGEDFGRDVAVDGSGATYITGDTWSVDFPTTPGAFDRSHNGNWDAFVVKVNVSGSALLYATLLGGSDRDRGIAIAVDGSGAAYVAGETGSTDFPTTPGAFDRSYNGGYVDALVAKVNSAGSGLLYATFLGGSFYDGGDDIAVDGSGTAYVTGATYSPGFPTTPGAFDWPKGGSDAFMVKVNPSGSALMYAILLGGSDSDRGHGITIDGSGATYVTGDTWSVDFPTTPGAFDRSHNGNWDAFVVKVNVSGSALLYATLLGGNDLDVGSDLAVNGSGAAYVTGDTWSADFPTTPGAFDRSYNGGHGDAFVVKVNPSGAAVVYATFLGRSVDDGGDGIAVDGNGAAYVTGITRSSDFPTTPGAFDRSHNGNGDAFVVKVKPSGSALIYATFLGGSDHDWGPGLALDGSGSVYAAGLTYSTGFPTTPGTFDRSHNGDSDVFVAKLVLTTATFTPVVYLPQVRVDQPADPCQRYEPNDTLSTAWGPIANGQAIEAALCSGDPDDYFYVDLATAASLAIDLTNLPAGTDYDLVIYNAAGSQLAESRSDGTTPEHIVAAVTAGRYYVRVYPYQGRSSQAYRLTAAW